MVLSSDNCTEPALISVGLSSVQCFPKPLASSKLTCIGDRTVLMGDANDPLVFVGIMSVVTALPNLLQ